MDQKEKWQQEKLGIKTSPANFFYSLKNRINKLETRLRYDPFWLSWQTWWLVLWSIGQSVFYFFWLKTTWTTINSSLPIWYGFHNLERLLSSKTTLIFPITASIITPIICLIISKAVSKGFETIKSIFVLFQISLTVLTIVTIFKIISTNG